MFQSLFYWILFSYKGCENHGLDYKLCFNPYSIGFYSLITRSGTAYEPIAGVSILILLDSILL